MVMEWPEDFTRCSFEQIVQWQDENRAWQKELRRKMIALIDSKLARQIGPEEYAERRQQEHQLAEECKRRRGLLSQELFERGIRTGRPLSGQNTTAN
jgi:hypothetical protein